MPKLGQHFLKNQKALFVIAHSLGLTDGDVVIEIGPGHGELTTRIMGHGSWVKIIAIEKDPKLAEFLRKRFLDEPRIEIIEGDALKKISAMVLHLAPRPYKVAGNIPYYLTGKLLRTIGELSHTPAMCVFTIQEEVAERVVVQPPGMNRLAASVGFWARAEIIGRLPRTDFSPPPSVDSAIIKLTVLPAATHTHRENYYRAVRVLFSQPRKTILNNLAGEKTHSKEELVKKLRNIGLQPDLRPQNLTLENIVRIAQIL